MTSDALIVAGIDIGAATAKAVVLNENKILSACVIPTGESVIRAAESVMRHTLEKATLSHAQIAYIVATGYGRRAVTFAHEVITEISCHAKGANLLYPMARTVIDIGGQDSKVIEIDEKGNIVNFAMNDKCAAGTGRFLEVMARVLNADIEEIGLLSLAADAPCQISNTCTVFAESEMVSLRAEGKSRENILAGIHSAVAHRVVIMGNAMGFKSPVVFTGGVARNIGMKKALQDRIGKEIIVAENPQIIGALGAAILARKKRE
jgi:predicted CoA-substrate-specific enzyme activase